VVAGGGERRPGRRGADTFELDLSTAADCSRLPGHRARAHGLDALGHFAAHRGEPRAALKQVRADAHKFRGTGGSFGLPEITRLGAQNRRLIDQHSEKAIGRPTREALGLGRGAGLKLRARAGRHRPACAARAELAVGQKLDPS